MSLLNITTLRSKIYPLVDKVVKTGEPVRFVSKGHVLKIQVEKKPDKLTNLRPHNTIVGNPDELPDFNVWEWNEPKNLHSQ